MILVRILACLIYNFSFENFFFQAIDIWMGACTGFIFAALLEFTLTNYLWRKGTKVSESERIPTDNGHRKDFGPIEAAASAVASGLDPSMFTQMMSGTYLRTCLSLMIVNI